VNWREIGVDVRGRRYSVGLLLVAGGTLLLLLAAGLGSSVLPWFTFDALGVQLRKDGASLLGWIGVLCALGALATALLVDVAGDRLRAFPFKRTLIPVTFGALTFASVGLRYVVGPGIETGAGPATWSRAVGANAAFVGAIVVFAGAVLELMRDPDPLIRDVL
jgi:hypothetical protein